MREREHPPGELPAAEQQEIAQELVDDVTKSGDYLDVDSVDIVPLLDGNVQLALPADTQVDSIRFEHVGEGDDVAVTLEGSGIEDDNLSSGGPQMASNWVTDGGPWIYNMYLYIGDQKMADAIFRAKRYKLTNDGDPNTVYIRYDRWVGAQTYAVSLLPDPSLKRLRIQNFPYDAVEGDLKEWERYRPGADLPDVNCTSYTISYTLLGATASRNFDRCDEYKIWRNIDKPSSFWMEWRGKAKGNREAAYSVAWSHKQGAARSQHDLNKMVMVWPALAQISDSVCTQTDSDRTCHF